MSASLCIVGVRTISCSEPNSISWYSSPFSIFFPSFYYSVATITSFENIPDGSQSLLWLEANSGSRDAVWVLNIQSKIMGYYYLESSLVDVDGGKIHTSRSEGRDWERSLSEELLNMHAMVAEWRDAGVRGGENFQSFRENPQLCSPLC